MIYCLKYEALDSKPEDAKKQRELSAELFKRAIKAETDREVSSYKLARGEHGKPYFEGSSVHFNITNCRGLICCAVEQVEVGIDVETTRPFKERMLRAYTESEQKEVLAAEDKALEFLKFWTLKESLMKFTGDGLAFGTLNAEFTFKGGEPRYIGRRRFAVSASQRILSIDEAPYIISVCTAEKLEPKLVMMEEREL